MLRRGHLDHGQGARRRPPRFSGDAGVIRSTRGRPPSATSAAAGRRVHPLAGRPAGRLRAVEGRAPSACPAPAAPAPWSTCPAHAARHRHPGGRRRRQHRAPRPAKCWRLHAEELDVVTGVVVDADGQACSPTSPTYSSSARGEIQCRERSPPCPGRDHPRPRHQLLDPHPVLDGHVHLRPHRLHRHRPPGPGHAASWPPSPSPKRRGPQPAGRLQIDLRAGSSVGRHSCRRQAPLARRGFPIVDPPPRRRHPPGDAGRSHGQTSSTRKCKRPRRRRYD
jgi:hypothetical protein